MRETTAPDHAAGSAAGAAAGAAAAAAGAKGAVRNLGKPVALASRYYEEGADEITFLNITAFRDSPIQVTSLNIPFGMS